MTKIKVGNEIFINNKFGYVVILEKIDKLHVKVKFKNTGAIRIVNPVNLTSRGIKDYYAPIVSGIGCLGEYSLMYKDLYPTIQRKLYHSWTAMISRCYEINNKQYHVYGGKGVTVDKRWLNFSNYFEDCLEIEGFDVKKLEEGLIFLDKDKKQFGFKNKIYSKDTCIYISREENNLYRVHDYNENRKLKFIAIDKNNNKFYVHGMRQFCKENNLEKKGIQNCLIGKWTQYRGWKFRKLTINQIKLIDIIKGTDKW